MIEERWVALINQEIDGANSAEESRELAGHLESDPEARALFDELTQMGRLFDEAGEVDSPRDLHGAIMRSVDASRYAGGRDRSRRGLGGLLRLPARPSPRLAFATGVAAGACLLAIALLVLPERGRIDSLDIRGTLVPGVVGDERLPGGQIGLDLPGATGSARFERRGDEIAAGVSLDSDRELTVVFEHAPGVRFDGFRSGAGEEKVISLSSGRTAITHSGAVSYVAVFVGTDDEAAVVTMSISDGENVLFRRTIR